MRKPLITSVVGLSFLALTVAACWTQLGRRGG
jgi:hypothetical protein